MLFLSVSNKGEGGNEGRRGGGRIVEATRGKGFEGKITTRWLSKNGTS